MWLLILMFVGIKNRVSGHFSHPPVLLGLLYKLKHLCPHLQPPLKSLPVFSTQNCNRNLVCVSCHSQEPISRDGNWILNLWFTQIASNLRRQQVNSLEIRVPSRPQLANYTRRGVETEAVSPCYRSVSSVMWSGTVLRPVTSIFLSCGWLDLGTS